MTVPMSSIAETIADKMMLPRSEYACCIELDKETSQLESAIKLLSSAKSLIGLSKRIKVKSAMKSELSKKIRSPLWLDPTRTLTELEPLINARPLCFRRRFWFTQRPLDNGDKGQIFTEFQEIKEHLKIVGTLREFIKHARELPGFGDTFFATENDKNREVLLAISKSNLTSYHNGKLEERFPLDRVRRWMSIADKRLFTIEVDQGNDNMQVLNWTTDDGAEIQQLLDGYVQLTLHKKREKVVSLTEKIAKAGEALKEEFQERFI
ncbi:Oidioi.mRNA.OKI2018_I69.PAR.g13109.t1.cds [Oikopleura dioica]|uniref:Oidioi.mRNA.OKI2018_I69.PAR.g13109.t1.cds n=1 Tax=Oikopleura dioica TaxID=34765 RepID=A0ABN7S6C5_OIKDI|nr:Oidioi.mRNA.OKI2018_I69.PAR.g13109.t1.cds [Oikopleura dioica]